MQIGFNNFLKIFKQSLTPPYLKLIMFIESGINSIDTVVFKIKKRSIWNYSFKLQNQKIKTKKKQFKIVLKTAKTLLFF